MWRALGRQQTLSECLVTVTNNCSSRPGRPSPPAVPRLTSNASSQGSSSPTRGSSGDPVPGFQLGPGHCSPPGLWPTCLWIWCCRVGNPGRRCLRGSSSPPSPQLCPQMRNSCRQTQSPRPLRAAGGPRPCHRGYRASGAGSLDKTRQGQVSQHLSVYTTQPGHPNLLNTPEV